MCSTPVIKTKMFVSSIKNTVEIVWACRKFKNIIFIVKMLVLKFSGMQRITYIHNFIITLKEN